MERYLENGLETLILFVGKIWYDNLDATLRKFKLFPKPTPAGLANYMKFIIFSKSWIFPPCVTSSEAFDCGCPDEGCKFLFGAIGNEFPRARSAVIVVVVCGLYFKKRSPAHQRLGSGLHGPGAKAGPISVTTKEANE